MPTKNSYQNRIEILQGTLDMPILKTLQWGEEHGNGIMMKLGKQQLAYDYERWGRMVATIERIMTAN